MEKNNEISEYEYDSLWMSIRYCIERHTIAAHCHAKDIASIEYKRLNEEQKQSISKLINDEIYNVLTTSLNFTIEERGAIPQNEFRPLNIYYQALQTLNVNNLKELKKIYSITAFYNKEEKKWHFECVPNPLFKNSKFSALMDVHDLEVWQSLANLFDVKNYQKVVYNNKEIKCYETFSFRKTYEDEFLIKKVKRTVEFCL